MKILVIRTDRIGEVLLSTPILTALKEKWPEAEISMMIRPQVKELIEDNPYVGEIIEYKDKQSSDLDSQSGQFAESLRQTVPQRKVNCVAAAIKLARTLRKKNFDIVVIVNPQKEFHLAAFLAGIPIRVGFNRKWGFLLTHKVKDLKFLAEKHEVEYNLDLVRALGIEPKDRRLYLNVTDTSEHTVIEKLRDETPAGSDICRLVAIHPCTSNPKKLWPARYFARLGDLLMEKGYNIVIVSGAGEAGYAKEIISLMKTRPIDLAGKLTLKELAALFKRCEFLVSADSGPVHIAAAVGTCVITLFGRQDPGSRSVRWGPYGTGHIVIEKEKLEDISPSEVMLKIDSWDSLQ